MTKAESELLLDEKIMYLELKKILKGYFFDLFSSPNNKMQENEFEERELIIDGYEYNPVIMFSCKKYRTSNNYLINKFLVFQNAIEILSDGELTSYLQTIVMGEMDRDKIRMISFGDNLTEKPLIPFRYIYQPNISVIKKVLDWIEDTRINEISEYPYTQKF